MYDCKQAWVRWPDDTQTLEDVATVHGTDHVVIAHKGVFFISPLQASPSHTALALSAGPDAEPQVAQDGWVVGGPSTGATDGDDDDAEEVEPEEEAEQ